MCFWNHTNLSVKRVRLSLPLYTPGSVCMCVCSVMSNPWTLALQDPLSMELLVGNKCIPVKIIVGF